MSPRILVTVFLMLMYFGVGSLMHGYIVGPTFDWSNAWTWGWLLGWPVALVMAYWVVLLAFMAIGIVAGVVIAVMDTEWFSRWRINGMLRRVSRSHKRKNGERA